MQNLITFEKALKENYLPVWQNQLGIEPSALLGKIKHIPLKGDKIVATAPIGLNGGFGFGAEGADTPASGNLRYERFITNSKDMYVNLCISAKTVRLGKEPGAMVNALDSEVKSGYQTAKWNVGRALFGNGEGILTAIEALEAAGNVITVADTKFVKEGLIIDIYAEGSDTLQAGGAGRRILSVNKANKTITVSGDAQTFEKGFITVQNSYKREITGLGAIFDDNITSIYGVSKNDNHYLKPVLYDGGNDISDGAITKVLREAKNDKGSDIDLLLCGDDAYDNYVEYLRTNNIRVEEMSKTITGGFKAIKFIFGNREVDLVNESFVPEKEVWGVDSSSLELHIQEWDFAQLQGGGIFNLMENKSVYRALLANYGDLICTNPGGCVRMFNCA